MGTTHTATDEAGTLGAGTQSGLAIGQRAVTPTHASSASAVKAELRDASLSCRGTRHRASIGREQVQRKEGGGEEARNDRKVPVDFPATAI